MRECMDVCAALHIHHACVIGTSFGGLLAMGLAAARPGLVRAAVLNDIGPDIGSEGAEFVRDFVGTRSGAGKPGRLRRVSARRAAADVAGDRAAWRRMAELTYQPGADGRWHPVWDTRIARLLNGPTPDLWPLFGALAHVPVLLVRGAVSNILLPETVTRMQAVASRHGGRDAARHRPCADPDGAAGAGCDPAVSARHEASPASSRPALAPATRRSPPAPSPRAAAVLIGGGVAGGVAAGAGAGGACGDGRRLCGGRARRR